MKYSFEHRFWKNVRRKRGCWEWTGYKRHGYGGIQINGIDCIASRVSYALHNGIFDNSLHVLHTCDNPECVNPKHLFLGTHQDNMRDMVNKGRARKGFPIDTRGTNNTNSKLTEEDVINIRRIYKPRKTPRHQIARIFGVEKSTIDSILGGKTWAHVGGKCLKTIYRDEAKKECSECGEIFLRSNFYNKKSSSDGITASCKACTLERNRR